MRRDVVNRRLIAALLATLMLCGIAVASPVGMKMTAEQIQIRMNSFLAAINNADAGSLLYWAAKDGPAPLAPGDNGQVLKLTAGLPTWADAGTADSGLTANSIPYVGASGILSESTANLFWDPTANSNELTLGSGTSPGNLKLLEGSGGGTNFTGILAPSTLAGNTPFTLPNAYPGSTLPVLCSSAGVLSTGALSVAQGGSGAVTLTGVLKGNGTSAFTAATAGTDYIAGGLAMIPIATLITPDTILGNEAGKQTFVFSGQGTNILPANYLDVGQHVHAVVAGTLTTDGSESEAITLTFDAGANPIFNSGSLDLSTAQTGSKWYLDLHFIGLTAGAPGSQIASGSFTFAPTGGAVIHTPLITSMTETTTGTLTLAMKATWANGDASPDVASCSVLLLTGGDDA